MPGLGALMGIGTGAVVGYQALNRFFGTPEYHQAEEEKKLMGVLSDMAMASDVAGREEGGEELALELALLQSLLEGEMPMGYGEDEAFVNDQIQTPDAEGMEGILAMALGNQTGGQIDPRRVTRMTQPEPRRVFDRRLLPFASDPESL